jgi:hypothetical protein
MSDDEMGASKDLPTAQRRREIIGFQQTTPKTDNPRMRQKLPSDHCLLS